MRTFVLFCFPSNWKHAVWTGKGEYKVPFSGYAADVLKLFPLDLHLGRSPLFANINNVVRSIFINRYLCNLQFFKDKFFGAEFSFKITWS